MAQADDAEFFKNSDRKSEKQPTSPSRKKLSKMFEHYEKKLTKNIRPTNILQIYSSIW